MKVFNKQEYAWGQLMYKKAKHVEQSWTLAKHQTQLKN